MNRKYNKWKYHKELIYHLKMQHALSDDVLLWLDIVVGSVDIGISQGNEPRKQAQYIKQVADERNK